MKLNLVFIVLFIFSINFAIGQEILVPSGKYKVSKRDHSKFHKSFLKIVHCPITTNLSDFFFDIHEIYLFRLPLKFNYNKAIDTFIYNYKKINDNTFPFLPFNYSVKVRTEIFKKGKLTYYEGGSGELWYRGNVFYDKKGRPIKITLDKNGYKMELKLKYQNTNLLKEINLYNFNKIIYNISKENL